MACWLGLEGFGSAYDPLRLFSATERLELEACLRRQREDHGMARQANEIRRLDDGKSCQETSDFLYLDNDTIRGGYKSYRQDGWKGGQSRRRGKLRYVHGWKRASVAQRPRPAPISVLNLVWITPCGLHQASGPAGL